VDGGEDREPKNAYNHARSTVKGWVDIFPSHILTP
jgi:hypothetical protein